MEPPVRNTLQAKLILDGEIVSVTLDYNITGEYAFLNKVPLLAIQPPTLQLEAKVRSPVVGINLILISCKDKYLLCSSAEPEKKLSEIRDLIDEAEIVACCPYSEAFENELRLKYSLPRKSFPLNANVLANIKLAFLGKVYSGEEKGNFQGEIPPPPPPPYVEGSNAVKLLTPSNPELPAEEKLYSIDFQSKFRELMKENERTLEDCVQLLSREEKGPSHIIIKNQRTFAPKGDCYSSNRKYSTFASKKDYKK